MAVWCTALRESHKLRGVSSHCPCLAIFYFLVWLPLRSSCFVFVLFLFCFNCLDTGMYNVSMRTKTRCREKTVGGGGGGGRQLKGRLKSKSHALYTELLNFSALSGMWQGAKMVER